MIVKLGVEDEVHLHDHKGGESGGAAGGGEIWSQLWNSSMVLCKRVIGLATVPDNAWPRNILELGSGRGLCGLAAAKRFPQASVTLSDVNDTCITNLHHSLTLNGLDKNVKVIKLNWYDESTYPGETFDLILGSDILYMERAVKALQDHLLDRLLSPDGRIILVDPSRCYSNDFCLDPSSFSMTREYVHNDKDFDTHEADVKCHRFVVLDISRQKNKN